MRWLFIIHQLPPEPPYLRAKIRNRLARVGAVALKNSVYALPERDDCLEDLQWIAEEATSGGGEAFVGRVELVA
jgi:DNA-binding transcriptional regulator PaaX